MVEDQDGWRGWSGRCQPSFQASVDGVADGGDVGNAKRARAVATGEVQGQQFRVLRLVFPKLFDLCPFGCWFLNFEAVLNHQQFCAVNANAFPVSGRDSNGLGGTKTTQHNGIASRLAKRRDGFNGRPKLRGLLLVVKKRFSKCARVVFGVRGLLNGDQNHFARVDLQKFHEGLLKLGEVLFLVHDAVVQFEAVFLMAAADIKKSDARFKLLSDRQALALGGSW